jgi:4-aminobutyrate aminotransferase-like enzyme
MKYINLKTSIPHKKDLEFFKKLTKVEAQSMHGQLPIVWDKAYGVTVEDRHGNLFLDFTSGICVTNIGHGMQSIRHQIQMMLDKPLLHTYTYGSEIRLKFLEALSYYTKFDKAFLVSSGTEATEAAFKLMKMHGKTAKRVIISFIGAMHGRTLAAKLMAYDGEGWITANDKDLLHFHFPTKGDTFAKMLDFLAHCGLDPKTIGGFMIESYRGWDARFFPKKFIQDLSKFAKENGALVCFDEIQSGMGRTGKLFAYEHYGVEADLVCLGKGLSSSLPLSAVLGRKEIIDLAPIGTMSSTHSANPLSCAAGYGNLTMLFGSKMIDNSRKLGILLHKELNTLGYEIQGKGLVAAILTKDEEEATKIVQECFKRGLLLIWTHKNSIKIAPPLCIREDALLEGINVIKEAIKHVSNKSNRTNIKSKPNVTRKNI